MTMVINTAMQESVWGDGWYNLCTLISQCTTGVQPYPAPESNQSDLAPVRLPKPAIIHTHSHNQLFFVSVGWLPHKVSFLIEYQFEMSSTVAVVHSAPSANYVAVTPIPVSRTCR